MNLLGLILCPVDLGCGSYEMESLAAFRDHKAYYMSVPEQPAVLPCHLLWDLSACLVIALQVILYWLSLPPPGNH